MAALDQILLFGDSITEFSFDPALHGWGLVLAHSYARKLDVINRGHSGYNSVWSEPILEPILKSTLPPGASVRIFVLFVGANDASLKVRTRVSIDTYKANMTTMLATVRRLCPGARVLVVTPPPVDPAAWEAVCIALGKEPDRNVAHTKKYRDACLEFAAEHKDAWGSDLLVVDTWDVFLGKGRTEYDTSEMDDLLCDGLHFAKKGNLLLGTALVDAIKAQWPDLDPDTMKMPVPQMY
ncbi:isoamyl acetate-hydrolyzing esterase [Entophlyctis luteolus]|nr:isoamyl acetate-hydrolyzing esterase [Entophlyctis luteolus]KAJ3352629.1 isoamyl acetate-hydrolyzing esterase [Entophlyctis luteolus]KAJ3391230.1 isoamyl acetate-hydrolyzing esterase [Entophlyctis sp. JEL0112]